jgi:DNA invertase Pin-like site-specific DNA recombinase
VAPILNVICLMSIQAYIYCRVSTPGQTGINKTGKFEQYFDSLDTQKYICQQACAKNKFKVVAVYEDVGSGTNMKLLTNFNRMMKDIKANAHKSKIIVISDLTRFSRNTLQGLQYIEQINKLDCDILNVKDNINYNNVSNRNIFRIRLSEAQNESEVMSVRQRNSINVRRRLGYKFGRVPYGFSASRVDGIRKFIPEQSEVQIVNNIIDMKHKNNPTSIIANKLNQLKKFKRGEQWTASMVNGVLKNNSNKLSLSNNNKLKHILKDMIKPDAKTPKTVKTGKYIIDDDLMDIAPLSKIVPKAKMSQNKFTDSMDSVPASAPSPINSESVSNVTLTRRSSKIKKLII